MSSSRIVRGTKARIFLYVCAVLIITAILACYNNTLSQLDDARKSSDICHQQEENLSTQLQVISDYKQRLEKSLKTEKAEHQQSKNDLENKLKEEKTKYEKDTSEANLRFSSLQQHFNLLKTQHGDFKDECSKSQKNQLVEINDIQAKLKEVQEELKKVISSKESLKTEYLQIQIDKEALQKELKNNIDNKGDNESKFNNLEKANHELLRELNELKEKCSALEVAPVPGQIPLSSSTSSSNKQLGADEYALKPPEQDRQQQEAPQFEKSSSSNTSSINVIKIPSKSTTSSSFKVSQANLDGAVPLIVPTVTPKSDKLNKAGLALPLPYVKLPEGVVPVPPKHEPEQKNGDEEKNELENSETVNNRYRNKIESPKEELKKNEENDNVGNEVFDNPGAHHAGYDHLGFGDVNDPIKNAEKQQVNKQHIDNLAVGDKVLKHYDNDYRGDNQNDLQIEDNDPEDDDPEYGAEQLGRLKDAIVRN